MTKTDEQQALEMMKDIAARAENHRLTMVREGMSGTRALEHVKWIVDSADIVFGIWADPDHPEGFDALVIKGAHLLAELAIGNKEAAYAIDAIPCVCVDQALAAKDYFEPVN
jgi:hypothetical protein